MASIAQKRSLKKQLEDSLKYQGIQENYIIRLSRELEYLKKLLVTKDEYIETLKLIAELKQEE